MDNIPEYTNSGLFIKPTTPFTFKEPKQIAKQAPKKSTAFQITVTRDAGTLAKIYGEIEAENIPPQSEPVTEIESAINPIENDNAVQMSEPEVVEQKPDNDTSVDNKADENVRVIPLKVYLKQHQRITKNDDTDESQYKFCRPFHKSLADFIDRCIHNNLEPVTNLSVELVSIAHGASSGLWDEGGAYNNMGRALVVTSPNGERMAPTSVFHSLSILNGRHALVPVWPGCFVIFAGKINNKAKIAIYRITACFSSSTTNGKNSRGAPNCHIELSGYGTVAYKQSEIISSKFNNSDWDIDHPAVRAAIEQCTTQHSCHPGYVLDYRTQHLDANILQDVNSCILDCQQNNFLRYKSLQEAYDALDAYAGKAINEIAEDKTYRLYHAYVYVYVYYDTSRNTVSALLAVVKYNTAMCSSTDAAATPTSKNRLWYGQVDLTPEEGFWYPDQTPDHLQSYQSVLHTLTSTEYHGRSLVILRRMTRGGKIRSAN